MRDALWQIAGVLAERDAEIAGLRAELARLRPAGDDAGIGAVRSEQPERPQDGQPETGPDGYQ